MQRSDTSATQIAHFNFIKGFFTQWNNHFLQQLELSGKTQCISLSINVNIFNDIYQAALDTNHTVLESLKSHIDSANADCVPLTAAGKLMEDGHVDAADMLVNQYGASIHLALLGAIKAGRLDYLKAYHGWETLHLAAVDNIRLMIFVAAYFNQVAIIDFLNEKQVFPWEDVGLGAGLAGQWSLLDHYWTDDNSKPQRYLMATLGDQSKAYLRSNIPNQSDGLSFLVSLQNAGFRKAIAEAIDENRTSRGEPVEKLSYSLVKLLPKAAEICRLMKEGERTFTEAEHAYASRSFFSSATSFVQGLFAGKQSVQAAGYTAATLSSGSPEFKI